MSWLRRLWSSHLCGCTDIEVYRCTSCPEEGELVTSRLYAPSTDGATSPLAVAFTK